MFNVYAVVQLLCVSMSVSLCYALLRFDVPPYLSFFISLVLFIILVLFIFVKEAPSSLFTCVVIVLVLFIFVMAFLRC